MCIATLGPGALGTSLDRCGSTRYLGAMPMIMITGPEGDHDGSRQARFQIVDVVRVDAAADQDDAPDRQSQAIHPDVRARRVPGGDGGAARAGAPELPEDIAGEETETAAADTAAPDRAAGRATAPRLIAPPR